jgi:hypothetical protein
VRVQFGLELTKDWDQSPISLTLLANTPQIVLSVCYLALNGLFTRMLSEREWAAFSVKYSPLRVTNREGKQLSTFRLQLPYRWSIPLIATSTLLHWLFSNCIYVAIYEGQYPYLCSLPFHLQKLLKRTRRLFRVETVPKQP